MTKIISILYFCISFPTLAYSQKFEEINIAKPIINFLRQQQQKEKLSKLSQYINSDYFFLNGGLGLGINVAYRDNILNADLAAQPKFSPHFNIMGGMGVKFLKHHIIGFEYNILNFQVYYGMRSNISDKEYYSGYLSTNYSNISLYYLHDLTPKWVRNKFFAGGNIGIGFPGSATNYTYTEPMYDDPGLGFITYEYNRPMSVFISLGPQLCYEWNFSRFASLLIRHIWYINPHYAYHEKINFAFTGEPPIDVERKIGFMNFSLLNVNLKIRMILFQKLKNKNQDYY